MTTMTFMRAAMAGVMGLTIVGCQNDKAHLQGDRPQGDARQELIAPEGQRRSVHTVLATQANRGAVADGMLYSAHFDGAELNSLGRQKLDAIAAGTSGKTPVKVYLSVGEDDNLGARRDAVLQHLSAGNVAADRIAIEAGDNQATRHLASLDSAQLYKTEAGSIGGVQQETSGEGEATGSAMPPSGSKSK